MSVTWAGTNEWSLRLGHTPQRARGLRGLRRRVAAHRSATGLPARGSVELSEWRGVLDALAALPQIASGRGGGQPARPEALTKSSGDGLSSLPSAGAYGPSPVLAERRLA